MGLELQQDTSDSPWAFMYINAVVAMCTWLPGCVVCSCSVDNFCVQNFLIWLWEQHRIQLVLVVQWLYARHESAAEHLDTLADAEAAPTT